LRNAERGGVQLEWIVAVQRHHLTSALEAAQM
jgi:hypothetical protein